LPNSGTKASVLYVGDNIDSTTLTFSGYDMFFNHQLTLETALEDALKKDPIFSVKRIWGTGVGTEFPNTAEKLAEYNVIILSDVGSDTLRIYPEVMKGRKGVDRSKLVRDFVTNGGGLLMCGGYFSFGGYHNIGRYHDTPIEEALPVTIKDGDDRVDTPDGFKFSIVNGDHTAVSGIDWNRGDFYLLGYNKLTAKPGAKTLATYDGDPIITVWEYGKGRSMAFASDCNLHWAGSFLDWHGYARFWQQAIRWLAKLSP
jgi:uncharacterized membrane protein